MDPCSDAIVRVYNNYTCMQISSPEDCLMLEVDSRIHNFSFLAPYYTYDSCGYDATSLPGLNVHTTSSAKLVRRVTSETTHRYKMLIDCVPVHVCASYNGTYLLITHMETTAEYLHLLHTVNYMRVLLVLYQQITGTKQGLHSYAVEAVSYISSVDTDSYVPASTTYASMLQRVCTGFIDGESVVINPKYDGVAYWMYASPTTPLSLLAQTKSRGGIIRKYMGRLSDMPHITSLETYAALVELLPDGSYIVVDMYTKSYDAAYVNRVESIVSFIDAYVLTRGTGWSSYVTQVSKTQSMTLGPHSPPLTGIMNPLMMNIDGYVVYVGKSKPLKVKLCTMVTVDLEYSRSRGWLYTGGIVLPDPPAHILDSSPTDTVVLEINVHMGAVVRDRPDRDKGNPKQLVDIMVSEYRKDCKYSHPDVWTGSDIRLSILLNRVYKSYVYRRYVPQGVHIVDMGSGNGADSGIWTEMSYKVLAVEMDQLRVSTLRRKVSDMPHVKVVHCTMQEAHRYLGAHSTKYKMATFMRSASHLKLEEMKTVLHRFMRAGVNMFVVVTMVRDYVQTHTYTYGTQTFSITVDDTRSTVSYNVDKEIISYKDYLYTLQQWTDLAQSCSLSVHVDRQSEFMRGAYGMLITDSTYPCFTDVALVLTATKRT